MGNSDVTAREFVENVEHRDVEGGTAPRAVRAQQRRRSPAVL
jgi:hypothetical protein